MKQLLLIGIICTMIGCKTTGAEESNIADETLDFGIVYARYGNEWWSMQEGEKWNKIENIYFDVVIIATKENENDILIEDFGRYATYINELHIPDNLRPPHNEFIWGILNYSTSTPKDTMLKSLQLAWNTGKYKEIRLPGWDGATHKLHQKMNLIK